MLLIVGDARISWKVYSKKGFDIDKYFAECDSKVLLVTYYYEATAKILGINVSYLYAYVRLEIDD